MTVQELIEELSKLDPDALVFYPAPPGSLFYYYQATHLRPADDGSAVLCGGAFDCQKFGRR